VIGLLRACSWVGRGSWPAVGPPGSGRYAARVARDQFLDVHAAHDAGRSRLRVIGDPDEMSTLSSDRSRLDECPGLNRDAPIDATPLARTLFSMASASRRTELLHAVSHNLDQLGGY
jgi:hypothetical protein